MTASLIYLCVSTEDQAVEGTSPESQEQRVERIARGLRQRALSGLIHRRDKEALMVFLRDGGRYDLMIESVEWWSVTNHQRELTGP
jgi:hypothetical protein